MNDASKAKTVLLFGTIGIIGVLFTIISDLFLLGRPDSAYSFFLLPTECMTYIPQWRIVLGTFLGVFMLPFQLAGLVPLYIGLRQSGKVIPAAVGIAGAHGLIIGVAFHTTYAFMSSGWKLYHSSGREDGGISAMIHDFEFYWKLIIAVMVIDLTIVSILYVLTVLRGNTPYPRWMAVFNPLVIMAAIFLLLLPIPAPVGGYISPAVLNLATLTFFILSAAVLFVKTKNT